jgi:alkylation response protein AidB-like acyl-CoA dehydrogenase
MVATATSLLTDEMLARFRERAPMYDRENRFFQEDFDELKNAGYLKIAVPQELGGMGLNIDQVMRLQRKIAYVAAPTALGVNMHVYWTGVFADVWRSGDKSVEKFLRDAAAGEVFAAGHAESGIDLPLLLSTTRAERVDGGYKIYGHKSFGSLTPVWTRYGMHAMDSADPTGPKIVHAFMPKGTPGYSIKEVWDTLGMRATKSEDVILDGVFIPDESIVRVVPAGAAGMDYFILCVFAWALLGFANVYYGLAQRALDETIANVQRRKSIALSDTMAHHPEVQHEIADMAMELDGIGAHLDQVQADWVNGVDHGPNWAVKLIAAKYHTVKGGFKIVDTGLDVGGGFGIFKSSGYERLWRDARLGRIHPANSALAHELVAKTVLGIDPDATPRWG